MYDVIRTKNVSVDFCPQMTLHDIPKMSQIRVKSSNVTILSFSLCIRIIDVCFSWHMRRAKMKNKVLDVGQDSPDGLDLSILIFDNLRWKSSPTITSFRNTLQKSTCRYFHFVNQDMHGFFPFKY